MAGSSQQQLCAAIVTASHRRCQRGATGAIALVDCSVSVEKDGNAGTRAGCGRRELRKRTNVRELRSNLGKRKPERVKVRSFGVQFSHAGLWPLPDRYFGAALRMSTSSGWRSLSRSRSRARPTAAPAATCSQGRHRHAHPRAVPAALDRSED